LSLLGLHFLLSAIQPSGPLLQASQGQSLIRTNSQLLFVID
jgi:hypothetical protein